jgi:hypothetical protein
MTLLCRYCRRSSHSSLGKASIFMRAGVLEHLCKTPPARSMSAMAIYQQLPFGLSRLWLKSGGPVAARALLSDQSGLCSYQCPSAIAPDPCLGQMLAYVEFRPAAGPLTMNRERDNSCVPIKQEPFI